jgi:hypothetical protein
MVVLQEWVLFAEQELIGFQYPMQTMSNGMFGLLRLEPRKCGSGLRRVFPFA